MAAIAVAITVHNANDSSPLHPRAFLGLLGEMRIMTALGTSSMHLAAQFTIYALMAALLIDHFGLAPAQLPMAMLPFGLGSVLGTRGTKVTCCVSFA
jgi:predicted MFS family arabinose efflux permease